MASRDSKTVPYEEALAQAGYGKLQWLVTLAGAMCILCSYVAVSSISFVLPSSQCDLNLTSQGKGTLIAFGFVGIIIGSHLWGFLSDTLGRRYILTRCLLADGILYICTSFVPNYWLFLIMRLFNGFSSCGAVVPAWAYIGEFHTDKHRTPAIMVASIIGVSIYIWLPCLAWVVLPLEVEIQLFSGLVFKSWRLFYLLCGIPSLLTFILMLFLPESPKFLLAKGEDEDCIKVLQYVYSKNTGKPPEELMIPNVTIDDNEKIAQPDGKPSNIKVFFEKMWVQTIPLFRKPLCFNFFILCTMQFILYFCNNGMFLWVPETVNRIAIYRESNPNEESTFCLAVENYQVVTIDNSILTTPFNDYNSTELLDFNFMESKDDINTGCNDSIDFTVYRGTIIIGTFAVIGLIVMIFLMKIFSRKFVLACFLVTSFIMMLLLIMLNELDLVFSMISTMLVCTGSAIPVVTSAVVDHFPTNLRAMAVCLTLMTGRIGTIVASQIVGSVLDTHCNVFLYCFAVLLAFCTLLVTFLPHSSKSDSKKVDCIEEYGSAELNQKNIV